jgi:penicillin-binding protein 1A
VRPIRLRFPDRLTPWIRRHPRLFIATVLVVSIVMWAGAVTSAWMLRDVVTGLPDNAAIRSVGSMAQATLLLDSQGKPAFTIFSEQRIEVPLSRMSRHLVQAIVAVEDQRFYDHRGVDIVRILGAAVNNVREQRAAQGGSTLTQQLARQSFLTTDKTFRRKVKEVILAARLEREYTKSQILELYLNKVYFGDGLYGVEAASLGFFGKHAAELDLGEAALLAGLVKSPSTYAPTVSEERARTRRNVVLRQMRDSGVIDAAAYKASADRPVVLKDALRREEKFGLYFKEEVRKQLVERFGWERVYEGGLKVYTTIDPETQKAAESEVARALEEIDKRRQRGRKPTAADEPPLQAALVAIDPRTGDVRAMVGGRDFEKSAFNRATQAKRQPGSAFKPFVYAAAIEAGYSPGSVLVNLNEPIQTIEGAWVPDDDHGTSDSMTMRAALRTSSNRAAVRMLEDVGIPETVRYAKLLGVGSVPSVPSLALGSGEVTLVSMTTAYGAFATGGLLPTAALIRRVEGRDGTVLFESKPESHRVIKDSTAFLMTTMMADVINSGTAWTVRREGFTLPAAGKTGTTNDYHDAWFVGYTPKLVTGVWVGFDQPKTIMGGGYAAELAVPMWSRFMKAATRRDKPEWFRPPKNVTTATICRLSGGRAVDGCRDAVYQDEKGELVRGSLEYTEYFVAGTEPVDDCPIHGPGAHPTLVSGNGRPLPGDTRPGTVTIVTDGRTATVTEPPKQPDQKQPEKKQPEKKKGFWGKIFGR